jgi:mono/diheme cytochrome c family protein/uncharacterized membrane protein
MLTGRCPSYPFVLGVLLALLGPGGGQLSAQTTRPASAGAPAVAELFRQHCIKCHGADGTGSPARDRLPEIPDFTDAAWQSGHGDGQILASILDGVGTGMPPFRDKVSEDQTRGLAAHVRWFAPAPAGSGQGQREGAAPTEPAGPGRPRGFFEKLIAWLGNSHPPAVHFPIALLTAAALAELLLLATGKPAFDAAARYCVWFGALGAAAAGALGWCAGGVHLTDPSWVLTTHRWLGTCTIAGAVLVLVLSELSRRPGRRRTRVGFRLALLVTAVLVLATGFFGGAVVHGLGHYAWPS